MSERGWTCLHGVLWDQNQTISLMHMHTISSFGNATELHTSINGIMVFHKYQDIEAYFFLDVPPPVILFMLADYREHIW